MRRIIENTPRAIFYFGGFACLALAVVLLSTVNVFGTNVDSQTQPMAYLLTTGGAICVLWLGWFAGTPGRQPAYVLTMMIFIFLLMVNTGVTYIMMTCVTGGFLFRLGRLTPKVKHREIDPYRPQTIK